jgi:eukaryotic-like serine/threonine-protein kinase
MIGRTLGRYQILEKIGAGGMGEVFLAHDSHLDRQVAIKVLPAGSLGDDSARRRFHGEALALSRVNHPNIATVHDFASEGGTDFLVMEYVPGNSLGELLGRGPLSEERIRAIGVQLADGVAAAHRQGIVHRDLKPGNIRVTPEGQVKILDFGLAKHLRPAGTRLVTESLTGPRTVVGTPAYMSPEQFRGDPVGPASDLFSLGVVLYEMMTGQRAFEAPSFESLAYKVLHDQPPTPSTVRRGLPHPYDRLVADLLRKDPEERPKSADEVAERLRSGADGRSGRPGRALPSRVLRVGAIAGGVLGSLLLVAYLKLPEDRYAVGVADGVVRRLTFSGHAGVPCWSPDGRYIAYRDKDGIYVTSPEGGAARKLNGPWRDEDVSAWGWTPDSREVLVHGRAAGPAAGSSECCIFRAPLDSSARMIIRNACFAAMSPDGRTLAFVSLKPEPNWVIWLMDLATGAKRKLAEPRGAGTATYKPKWSPDGRRLTYIRWTGHGHELWLIGADGRNDHRIETGPIALAGQYAWNPDGKAVMIGGDLNGLWGIWRIPVSGHGIRRFTAASEEQAHVGVAPDGKRFAFQTSQDISRIAVIGLQGDSLRYPFDMNMGTQHPAFSPDGSALLFECMVNGRWQIWRAPLDHPGAAQPVIALGQTSALSPAVTVDGRLLHVRADVGRRRRFGRIEWAQTVWASALDGSGAEPFLPGQDRVERLAPGSFLTRTLLFTSNTIENGEALFVRRPGEQPLRVFEDNAVRRLVAFDWGRNDDEVLLAMTFDASPGPHRRMTNSIASLNPATSEMRNLLGWDRTRADAPANLGGVTAIAMSPDRRHLALLGTDPEDERSTLHVYDLLAHTGQVVRRFEADEGNPNTVAWSPRGDRLAVELQRARSDIFIWQPQDGRPLAMR